MGSGGAQTIVRDLARCLPSLGVDVEVAHLFAPNFHAEELASAGTPVHDLASGTSYTPRAAADLRPAIRLRRLVASMRPDVINLHLYIAPLHLRALTPSRSRPVVVNTIHAHREHLPRYVFPSYRLTRSMTDAFVLDFAAQAVDLRRVAPGIPATCIPFGVEPIDPVASARDEVRRELGMPDTGCLVMSIARLHPQRSIDRFVEAFASFAGDLPDAALAIVGDGPLETELRAQAERAGLARRAHFLGRRSDLDRLLAAADVAVSMSVGGDVGIAALQAASAGVPVLAWDILGRKIVADDLDEQHPCLTAGPDHFAPMLRDLVASPDLRRQVGNHGYATTRSRFSAASMTASYAELYRSLAAGR